MSGSYQQAVMKLQSGDLDGAIIDLKNLLPTFEVMNLLGVIFQLKQDWRQAHSAWSKAVELNPTVLDVRLNLGLAAIALGDDSMAKQWWESIIEIDPNHIQALVNLGLFHRERENNDIAHDLWTRVLRVDPSLANIQEWIADVKGVMARQQMSLGFFEQSKNLLNEALEFDSTYDALHLYMAEWYVLNNSPEDALSYCHKALELAPENPIAHHVLAVIDLKCGRRREALDGFRLSLKFGGGYLSTHRYLYELDGVSIGEKEFLESYRIGLLSNKIIPLDHFLNPEVYHLVDSYLNEISPKPKSILELACGSSQLGLKVHQTGIIGVDSSELLLNAVRNQDGYSKLILQDQLEFLRTEKRVDVVVDLVNIQLTDSVSVFFDAVFGILNSSGQYIFLTEQTGSGQTYQMSGNMSYSKGCIQEKVLMSGFSIVRQTQVNLRRDGVRWIVGDLWMLYKP